MKICQRVPCVFNLFLEQLNFSKQTTPFFKNQINLAGVIILKKTLTHPCFFSLQFHKKNYVIVLFTVTFFFEHRKLNFPPFSFVWKVIYKPKRII